MAMEFFKNCTTNVHVVDTLAHTRYTTYTWTGLDELKLWRTIQCTLTRLREQNVLCTAAESEVWIFGDAGATSMQDQEDQNLNVLGKGTLDNDSQKTSANGKPPRELLLDAIESSIAFALASDENTTHIGPWTWIYSGLDGDVVPSGQNLLIQLHAKFTKTESLFLIPEITATSLLPAQAPADGTEFLLAPCTRSVRVLPADAVKVISDDQWKEHLVLTLGSQGITLSDDVEWISVQPVDGNDDTPFIWPTRLCFMYRQAQASTPDVVGDRPDWRPWFATTEDNHAFRNPLAMAEEWFHDFAELTAEATAVGPDTASIPTNAVHGQANEGSNAVPSPLNQRLLDQQAAMAGIYPTPPDGLAQVNQASQINVATTPSVTQGDTSLSGNELLATSDDKINDSHGMAGVDSFALGQEDLFGDAGEMEFEENNIEDEDFNFFDDGPVGMPGVNIGEDAEILEVPDQEDATTTITMHAGVDNNPSTAKVEQPESVLENMDFKSNTAEDLEDDPSFVPVEDVEMKQQDDIKEEPPGMSFDKGDTQPEKPLSPFGIKERLLPPPVPASVAQLDSRSTDGRRNSAFSPILFRSNTNWREKYAIDESKISSTRPGSTPSVPSISLPKTRKKSRTLSGEVMTPQMIDEGSESEEDSFESPSSDSEPDLPPKMPWDNRKRKRHSDQDLLAGSLAQMHSNDAADADSPGRISLLDMLKLLKRCSIPDATAVVDAQTRKESSSNVLTKSSDGTPSVDSLPTLENSSDLRREDLIYIAQVVSMQVVTTLDLRQPAVDLLCSGFSKSTIALSCAPGKLLKKTLDATFDEVDVCDVPKMAMSREPMLPQRAISNPSKTPQGQPPRPLQRSDSMMNSPDYFALQAPYVKIRRGPDNWEMLPTCLSFWETLGLGPANGPKDVRAFCVFPDNEDLQILVEHFMADIGTAYEGCKLGSHNHLRNVDEKDDSFEDGLAPVELEESSMQGALKAYANTCIDLGKALASFSHMEVDRTIVVYMINPFPGDNVVQHLCACFWQLFKTYRDNLPKAHRSHCGSDVVLQLVPISLIAAPDMMVVQDAKQIAILAREVYDRCPPSAAVQGMDNTSVLPIFAAPSLELAGAAPRKIGFSLSADPPSDLLHEGSILHLAYAVSKDGFWLTALWIDNTSQYQASSSFCLRGKSFADVADEVWERTCEIMAARKVTWRVFVVSHQYMDKSISHCWRGVSSKPRPQSLCVTLLSCQLNPIIQLSPPITTDSTSGLFDPAFLTPATTPQAATFTSSPDASTIIAPPTPAPSDLAESDPDAHLIDLTDETWGLLLSPKFTESSDGLSAGALYRRGEGEGALDGLGVTLHWTIQVKPGGAVDEGSPKQGDLTLREVLRMYRNLSLLTRARGLERQKEGGPVPVHVVGAMRGAEGLEGLLRRE